MADHSQPLELETHDSSWGKILLIAPVHNHVFDMLEPLTVLSDRLVAVRTSSQLMGELEGASVLPICILLPWQEDNPPELDELTQTIKRFRKGAGAEVPLLVITNGSAPVPLELKPSGTVSDAIPPDVLLPRIAGLRRLANRAEEARLRRGLFGALPEYKTEFGPLKSAGLLVAGFGKHFGRTQALLDLPVEIVGGFSSEMTEDYLAARRFEAVLIDMPAWQACEEIERLRADHVISTSPYSPTALMRNQPTCSIPQAQQTFCWAIFQTKLSPAISSAPCAQDAVNASPTQS